MRVAAVLFVACILTGCKTHETYFDYGGEYFKLKDTGGLGAELLVYELEGDGGWRDVTMTGQWKADAIAPETVAEDGEIVDRQQVENEAARRRLTAERRRGADRPDDA